jgi:predicted ArsR family transcriptional regulator
MNFNIRERWQKVWACLQRNAQQSVREIARATGIAKSSVQRHLQAIRGRQQYPESFLWETEEGEQ